MSSQNTRKHAGFWSCRKQIVLPKHYKKLKISGHKPAKERTIIM